jgi:hypothetical protein
LRRITQRLIDAQHSTCCCFIPDLCLQPLTSVHVESVFARCEFNTHVDTCAFGQNFVPLSYTVRICNVTSYNAKHGKVEQNVPIITKATAFTCQESGQPFIFVIIKGVWFGPKLSHSLLNQNQLQNKGVAVWDNPFDATNPISIKHLELIIQLIIPGMNIFLETCTPTQCTLDSCPPS